MMKQASTGRPYQVRKNLASRRESKAPGYEVSKERVTILACANATGDHKLRFTMVGKSKNPLALKNISHSLLPVRYTSQTSAWMDMKLKNGSSKNLFHRSRSTCKNEN